MKSKFRELNLQIVKMFSELDSAYYGGAFDGVQKFIDQVREVLAPQDQQIGLWEASELNHADCALRAGFPRLAMISVGKALAVHQLGADEYAFGFDQIRRGMAALAEADRARAEVMVFRDKAAAILRADQKGEAQSLLIAQGNVANDLELTQKEAASELSHFQEETAVGLARENLTEAAGLAEKNAGELKIFVEREVRDNLHQQGLGELLSWAAGGYSIEGPKSYASATGLCETMAADKEEAALQLKDRQDGVAKRLKETQVDTARTLQESQSSSAVQLKIEQKQVASKLTEGQTVKAIQKGMLDEGSTSSKK